MQLIRNQLGNCVSNTTKRLTCSLFCLLKNNPVFKQEQTLLQSCQIALRVMQELGNNKLNLFLWHSCLYCKANWQGFMINQWGILDFTPLKSPLASREISHKAKTWRGVFNEILWTLLVDTTTYKHECIKNMKLFELWMKG